MSQNLAIAAELVRLQNVFNRSVNEEWRQAGYEWWRAVWIECGEFVGDHMPWKWWKKGGTEDIPQMKIEAIDLLHFLLSWGMIDRTDYKDAATYAAKYFDFLDRIITDYKPGDWRSPATVAEKLAQHAISQKLDESWIAFISLAAVLGMGPKELRDGYVAKNALNAFRGRNGYKDGSYIKVWNGLEDNQVLEKIMADQPALTFDEILAALGAEYAKVSK